MKKFWTLCFLLFLSFYIDAQGKKNVRKSLLLKLPKTEKVENGFLLKLPSNPSKGFNYEYLLFIPNKIRKNKLNYLLVEPNNTGYPNDSITVHEKAARFLVGRSSVGNFVAQKAKMPLLVPIFPRPKNNYLIYTHALDRDAILAKNVKYQRLDLQLIAMIKDAKEVLKNRDISINEKVFLNGFSASGSFVNRFAFLHPGMIKAVATGGLNGILMLPQKVMAGKKLNYPLGINDYYSITNRSFNHKLYSQVPQFIYMGKKDTNDAAKYKDAYNKVEQAIIYEAFSKQMMPNRWNKYQELYRLHNINVEFKTYEHVGHGTPFSVLWEIVEFFKRNK